MISFATLVIIGLGTEGGNQISVKTLDLGAEWTEIKTQIEDVAAYAS